MLKLILKDFLIQKNFFIKYVLLFAIISIFATIDLEYKNASLIVGSVSIAYILITTAFAIDDKSKGQVIINSLPISKVEIVISKYISIFIFSIVGMITMILVSIPFKLLNSSILNNSLHLYDIKIIIIYTVVFFSINYPIYFKIGYVNASKFNIFMYLGGFFASYIFVKNSNIQPLKSIIYFLKNTNEIILNIIIILLLSIICISSIILSIKFYIKRDL